ncbi:protein of unknown function [Methylorubrum extorquens]|uniref:Uncharacterized protein n=1 Tax=Methylorubrum extorquens TaxID=408 RepID=A0A2N9AYI1_METEX|nr:protein of unknown function [Methylorubrum extorquens]
MASAGALGNSSVLWNLPHCSYGPTELCKGRFASAVTYNHGLNLERNSFDHEAAVSDLVGQVRVVIVPSLMRHSVERPNLIVGRAHPQHSVRTALPDLKNLHRRLPPYRPRGKRRVALGVPFPFAAALPGRNSVIHRSFSLSRQNKGGVSRPIRALRKSES